MILFLENFPFGKDTFFELHRADSFSFMRFCCSSHLKIPHCSQLLVASQLAPNTATGLVYMIVTVPLPLQRNFGREEI